MKVNSDPKLLWDSNDIQVQIYFSLFRFEKFKIKPFQ